MPMRINELNHPLQDLRAPGEPAPRSAFAVEQKSFQRQLHDMSREQYAAHFQSLVDRVVQQGEKLAERTDIKEFQRYREAVTELVKETVSESYEFYKSGSFDARGRHRVFAVVRKIDASLEDIAAEILSDQANNLKVLHKIDDIRGLVVDMLL